MTYAVAPLEQRLAEQFSQIHHKTRKKLVSMVLTWVQEEQAAIDAAVERGEQEPPSGAVVLREVSYLIEEDRARQHGDKVENHENIALIWGAYLNRLWKENVDSGTRLNLTPFNITQMMILLKVARTLSGEWNVDDMRDAAGYAGVAIDVANEVGR
jgi:hypothetical protein